ncbi:L-glyceraldehyde 3-phosphate reductase [Reichenbachiella sp.]|uniref:L-glyceraldehyde 3-phosphate reductase n=1 Tax=Reichenbachiella sp. TaxID=2184521 RepID=UPI003B5A49EC
MAYQPATDRYDTMKYRRCGKSGLLLPAISLGLWHNFGHVDKYENSREMIRYAFDHGITHFDLANNYGPPAGSAEENFGKMMREELQPYRDEILISTKAGHEMWAGPYGEWGGRKHILSSLDQSLKRLSVDYVDIFYSHRPDPNTPLEETALALDQAVKQGKALYVGISKYNPEQTKVMKGILEELKTPFIIHQDRYSMFDRHMEESLNAVLEDEGIGAIVFSPLAQGLLTDRYLNGIPENSRAARSSSPFLQKDHITEEKVNQIKKLKDIADARGQMISQLAIAWLLRNDVVTSVLIGASSVEQLKQNLVSIENIEFSQQELDEIENILKG